METDGKKIREMFFVLLTSLMIVGLLTTLKIGGVSSKQAPLLFIAAVIGTILYLDEKSHNFLEWIIASSLAFITFPLVYEVRTFSTLVVLALLFSIMIAMPSLLIRIRARLFSSQI